MSSNTNHLVFSRVTIAPTEAEFVSIYNPTNDIFLSDYYITDSDLYYNLLQMRIFGMKIKVKHYKIFLQGFQMSIAPMIH